MFKIKNTLRVLAASVAVAAAVGAAPSAMASPAFTVNLNNLGLGTPNAAEFVATEIIGGSAARIVRDAMDPNVYHATGYIEYSTFKNGSNLVNAFVSQVNGMYGLYATFSQTFTCPGNLGAGTGNCSIANINLSLYADAGDDNTYNAASIGADPTVNVAGAQILLGSVVGPTGGTAGVDAFGGAYQNAFAGFQLTAQGTQFFVAPDPFYTIAFSSFTNTGLTGATCFPTCANPDIIAINEEHGNTVFNGQPVPEPGPLALIGLGLLGLVAARRTKKAA